MLSFYSPHVVATNVGPTLLLFLCCPRAW